jgi:phytoene desaturase
MNYADMALGTWYPQGGMYEIVKAMLSLAESKGVEILLDHEVKAAKFQNNSIQALVTDKGDFEADVIITGADYHHFEQQILPTHAQDYSEKYWDKREMAPSSLLFYLGVNKKLDNILHHNLFFDESFDRHAAEIYSQPQWPSKPLFYASVTTKTDPSGAPEGHENLFLLMPVAPGLEDNEELRERYYELIMDRLEKLTGQSIKQNITYKRSYAHTDFINDYHAFKGNAYGLANTLRQTAILKPAMKSKKVKNLYYTGQLTVPGPGVPPSLISGLVVAREVEKDYRTSKVVV